MAPVTNIQNPQPRTITNSALAINHEIEHREFAKVRRHRRPHPDRPDFAAR
ncbi:hypothetical protein LMG30113_07376 [Burkholderia paludis]|nr:hypothetical protein LMG30113_07376 [Burkholderia paludis]